MSDRNIPRILVAGAASGVGKTTVMVGLLQAMRERGLRVSSFKCGPDYLDPTYHRRVTGEPSHNLDGWMMGREAVLGTFLRASGEADLVLIEGVMGLFDGASPTAEAGSSAEIAKWLACPVLLAVDASGMARSVAALARGFRDFDSDLSLKGMICNRVGSRGHLDLLRKACAGILPVTGGLPEEPELSFPERHLGLRTACLPDRQADQEGVPDERIRQWGRRVSEWFDLDQIVEIARSAPPVRWEASSVLPLPSKRCRIGLAFDEAFHFYYEDNLNRLEALGAELVRFSPIRDAELPAADGLYLGGGYPELFAAQLSGNPSMLRSVRKFSEQGRPIYAECGGLMYLCEAIRTIEGERFRMAGLLPGEARMRDRLQALGYVEVETTRESILGPAGLRFRGHQFRYSDLEGAADAGAHLYRLHKRRDKATSTEGYAHGGILGSYVHAHWASNPLVAEGFVRSCVAARRE
jgi:cobyrinic acid a,c-diamide synthase